jgi:hypothetical protein
MNCGDKAECATTDIEDNDFDSVWKSYLIS